MLTTLGLGGRRKAASGAAAPLTLTYGSSGDGVATDAGALTVTKYMDAPDLYNVAQTTTLSVVGGSGGSNVGIWGYATADTGWTVNSGNVIGIVASGEMGQSSANVYGMNVFASTKSGSGVTGVTLCGIEVGLVGRTGTTTTNQYGVMVVHEGAGVVQGSTDDVAYRVAGKNATGLFKHGLLIDTGGGFWPMDASVGKLIGTRGAGTTGYGLYFEDTTFASAAIWVPGLAVANVSGQMKTIISDAWTSTTPAARLHVKDTTTTLALIAQANNANRFDGQVQVRGNTDTNLRLYFGVETTTEFGLVQAIKNGTGALPLVLQPSGGVTVVGDHVSVAVSPDTAVLGHFVGTGSSMVALAFDSIKTSTSATAGANTLPANPVGFLSVKIAGTEQKIPYYAA